MLMQTDVFGMLIWFILLMVMFIFQTLKVHILAEMQLFVFTIMELYMQVMEDAKMNWLALIQYIGQQIFSYGIGFATIVWAIKNLRRKKNGN